MGKIQKLFSYIILPSDGNGLACRVLRVSKNVRKQTPLKVKNNATSFSDIFQSEQNWASYGVFSKTDDARTMLGCRTPFSFCLYTTFLSSMHSREQGPKSSVCMPVQHTLWLGQLYYFILVSLVVVFVEVYNATNILNQWRHLALNSELPGANSSITSETFWAASTNHRAQKVPPRPPCFQSIS